MCGLLSSRLAELDVHRDALDIIGRLLLGLSPVPVVRRVTEI
jgi:hypothetical protein